jgi:homoserine O-acetyltransferase
MATSQIGSIGDLPLKLGGVLRDAKLAYVTYGTLAPDGRNAILVTHGYTSTHMFIDGGASASEGSWSGLVGPGRAIDTGKYFVVSTNMLGSAFGSTAPRTVNPTTGKPYGPDFPAITLPDMIAAQKRLLDQLGVRELVAVVGPSYGGFQAFTWGIEFPGFMRGLVPVVTGLTSPPQGDPDATLKKLSADPNWNGGHYYENGGILPTMTALREATLRGYGTDEELMPRFPEKAARDAEITRQARAWAENFDGNSLLTLGKAMRIYDATRDLAKIKARVLFVLSRTDAVFPPSIAPDVMARLKAAGVDARYEEIDSDHGHIASGTDWAKWAPALKTFIESL